MGRQLRIVHRTGYRYRGLISASHNEARMTPRATREQFVLATRSDITPVAWSHSFIDYWEARAGVGQDLVHLGLGALRSVGIPTRYVSGYVMPAAQPCGR